MKPTTYLFFFAITQSSLIFQTYGLPEFYGRNPSAERYLEFMTLLKKYLMRTEENNEIVYQDSVQDNDYTTSNNEEFVSTAFSSNKSKRWPVLDDCIILCRTQAQKSANPVACQFCH